MSKKFIFLLFTILTTVTLISCREVTEELSEPVVFNPTPAAKEMVMAGAAPVVEVVIVGDPASGSEWFLNEGCNACHSTGAEKIVGPGFAGIYERAATRGYASSDDYIEASIRYPGEYIVEGYSNLMPASWEEAEKQEIADIISYLKTLE
tara:strand:+ start:103 stop:552 length:450 start_codon:yes stop_codon:yes gene_type:complete